MVFAHNSLSLTLVFYITLLLSLLTVVNASDVYLRDNAHLKRMYKKRAPQAVSTAAGVAPLVPVVAPGANPEPASITSDTATTSTTVTGAPISTPRVSISVSTPSAVSSSSSSASSASVGTSSSSSSSSPLSSSSSSSSATPAQIPTSAQQAAVSTSVVPGTSTRTQTAASQETSAPVPPKSAATQAKSTTLTVLIAVAASVGGVAIIWTIFRKWKLSRSSKFDQRMQPIDWQPTSDEGLPGSHRRFSAGSLRSDLVHSDDGHSTHSNGGLQPVPDHDFTARNANSNPVGGYADLTRGPSPQPIMQESLHRGPSLTRPGYDHDLPLHHQAGGGYDYNGARY